MQSDQRMPLDTTEATIAMLGLVMDAADEPDGPFALADVKTYEHAGVMTANDGLVIRLPDGTEFQLTVVQSRRPCR